MRNNEIKFDWDDILIVPKEVSHIRSRKEIKLNRLPLYVSPMDTVVNQNNAKLFWDMGFEVCLPRYIKYTDELKFCFFSYGLEDIKVRMDNIEEDKILIDIANGNMFELLTIIHNFKYKYPDKTLMVGNVANPMTYLRLSQAGADIIRVGVGNGSGCFVENTKVITKRGTLNIQNVVIGDEVLTHTGLYNMVYNTISYETDEKLIQINTNISTIDHEYYVLNKKYLNVVTDNNIDEYAEWVEASKLSKDYLLLENVVVD